MRSLNLGVLTDKAEAYRPSCGIHAPSMAATILVLPR
jgi:hypothetical protein